MKFSKSKETINSCEPKLLTLNEFSGISNEYPNRNLSITSSWLEWQRKFLQYISIEHAMGLLKDEQATLAEATFETGLSGTGWQHDLFINIEGMTPAEYKNGGSNLNINYSFAESPFGNLIASSTPKGICHHAFADNYEQAVLVLWAWWYT